MQLRSLLPPARPLTSLAACLIFALSACNNGGGAAAEKSGAAKGAADSASGQTASAGATARDTTPTARASDGTGPPSDTMGAGAAADTTKKQTFMAGESPLVAIKEGWPVKGPAPLAGALLPRYRILAYYGNPLSKKMGVLGEYAPEEMLRRLDAEIARWNKADPNTPVMPALQLISVVAQGDAGPSGKYRTRMRDSMIEQVSKWADSRKALVFLDVQVGTGTIQEEMPRLLPFLQRPNFHFAVDPEFMMKDGSKPGSKIGTMDASDINWVSDQLAQLVRKYNLPPKVLVIHRFTRKMITNADKIQLRPEVQIVINMDGWGAPWLKRDSYAAYVVAEPVQFTGVKLFYFNDMRKKGSRLMTPEEVLRLRPQPYYIQYQ